MTSNQATSKLLIESEIEIAFKNALKTQKLELISKPYLSSTANNATRGLLPSQIAAGITNGENETEDYYFMTVICDNLLLYYSPHANNKTSNNVLTEINLSFNSLSVTSLQLLLQTLTDLQISSLTSLVLNHCGLVKDHCVLLKYFLLSIRSLQKLSLASNQISNYGLQILSEAFLFDQDHLSTTSVATNSLLSKALMGNASQSRGGGGAGEAKTGHTPSSSPLSITPASIQQQFPPLPLSPENAVFTLQEIDLSNNAIQDSGILSFCRSCLYYNKKLLTLKSISSNLKRLFFNQNQITDKGIYCLAQLLNSKLITSGGNHSGNSNSGTNKPQLLPVNRFGIHLEEIRFEQNPHITSHGIICLLGNNHLTTNPTSTAVNTPDAVSANQHLILYTNVMTCCIHQTLKHIHFNECSLSLLIFQYLIPMISKGAFTVLETIHLEFTRSNALEVIETSCKHYNKVYGNNLSAVKSSSSLSAHSINSNQSMTHSSIVMSYCFQLLIDALLGINHKFRVSIKSIYLGQLPKIIFEQCIIAKKKLIQFQQQQQINSKGNNNIQLITSPNHKEIIDYHNLYEDCRKSLEFMNPAAEIFHVAYISNIEQWINAEQYHNVLYTTITPVLSIFPQVTSPDVKRTASASPLKGGRIQQPQPTSANPSNTVPPKHPDTNTLKEEKGKPLPKSSTSPFRGIIRGNNYNKEGGAVDGTRKEEHNNSNDNQYQSPVKEKAAEREQSQRLPNPSFSPDLQERRRAAAKPPSPQRAGARNLSRTPSPSKRKAMTIGKEENKTIRNKKNEKHSEAEEEDDDWIVATRAQQVRSSQTIPDIDEGEISDFPPQFLKKLQQEQTVAVHTLSTEIQKLLQVSTPAAIHVLSSQQQRELEEEKRDLTVSHYSNALTVSTTGNLKDGSVITILDPYEIEKASITSQLNLQQSIANASCAADFDQSFFHQQSLLSHDIQYELYNLTESLNQITEVKKEVSIGKKESNGQPDSRRGRQGDSLVRSAPTSPTRARRSNSASPTRYGSNNKEAINKYINHQITQYFEARYQKEIESIQTAMINIANHFSKLDNRFQHFYEKKVMMKLAEFETRLMEMEKKQSSFLTAAGLMMNPHQKMNERFIENLAKSTLQGPALDAFQQYFHQQQQLLLQQEQQLSASSESRNDPNNNNSAASSVPASNLALQQMQYRLDLLEQKLHVMSIPTTNPTTEVINIASDTSYHHNNERSQLEESYYNPLALLPLGALEDARQNPVTAANSNLSEMDLDYKSQLLRQLSSLDAEIARERNETFEVNHHNIQRLQQAHHHDHHRQQAPPPPPASVVSADTNTSPLSTSNAPTPFPIPSEYQNHEQQYNQQYYHASDTSLQEGVDPSFVPSALSNINRFERIAALHATFSDQYFQNNLQATETNHQQSSTKGKTRQNSTESSQANNNRRLSNSSNQSGNSESKRPKTPVKAPIQQAQLQNQTHNQNQQGKIQGVIPEYYYDTLLPDHFHNQNHNTSYSGNVIDQGKGPSKANSSAKSPVTSNVAQLHAPNPPAQHQHQQPPPKGYMQATRSAYHKRNVPYN